ncbi:NB-ARC domain-containing protein [Nocardiopsis sediminis]|uniref:NB-ARC domain-containing protein n=1 Tax=Nocardiopsis sediminis TaxID=1778267 RepID=A0ABV8FT90_9ACTN
MSDPVTPDPLPRGVRNTVHSAETVSQVGTVMGDLHMAAPTGAPRAPVIPRQVPGPPPGWHDRDAELRTVRDLVLPAGDDRGAGTPVLVVEGPRGIGKSALARKAAAATADSFDGGQLYVDYGLLDPDGIASPSEALGHALSSLGLAKEDIPARLHDRAAQFRTVTSGRRLLVVVEGATQAAQVAQLIPQGTQSAVLAVGSRARLGELAEDHAEWLTLPPLGPQEARELLVKRCGDRLADGAEHEALAEVVAACEGLPLALVIVAGRLKADPGLSVTALSAELADERRRLGALAFTADFTLTTVFNVAYEGLPAEAAALYRALGRWPGGAFDLRLAAAAGRGEPGEVAGHLATLRRAELVTTDSENRFRFAHGLLRLHAAGLAQEHDGAEARDTVLADCLDVYVATLAHADAAVMGPRLRTTDPADVTAGVPDPFDGDPQRALHWLSAERETILAAVREAEARGLDTPAYRIAESATALYLKHRHLADWIETGTRGADAARRRGASATEARLRALVSRPLTDLGRTGDALEQLERALYLVRDEDDLLLAASVQEFHGRYLDTVDEEAALAAFARARSLNERSDDPRAPRGAALARYFAGKTRMKQGEPARAIAELEGAVAAFEALEPADTRMAARARGSLAAAYTAADRTREAVAACTAAVESLHASGDTYYEAENLELLGRLFAAMQATDRAREHWSQARDLFAAVSSPRAAQVQALLDGFG